MNKLSICGVVVVVIILCIISFTFGRNYEQLKIAEKICMKAIKGNFSHWSGSDIVCNKGGVDYKIGYKRAKNFTP